MQDQLVFIIGPPRSGSTLLARMLGAHSQICAPAEPHLLTPLAHLGYYERVDQAAYDPIISQLGLRELVAQLPGGEAEYLEALRSYSDRLYRGLLVGSSANLLLDKTPAYALILDFAVRLYPRARYVVLTRHPMAIWSSVIDSFFDGDHEMAHRHNPIIERYVPAIARFLRDRPAPIHPVRYEELVNAPEDHMRSLCTFLDIKFEPAMVNYGEGQSAASAARGLGDPMKVASETRPTTGSLAKWTEALTGRPDRIAQCQEILASLDDLDLETWSYSRQEIQHQLAAVDPAGPRAIGPKLSRHVLERKLMLAARRRVGDNRLGRAVRRVRKVCDLLLR
ncbi:MAG: sulfotransferase [Myxococcota bacterium]